MKTESLVRFNKLYYGKVLLDINVIKLIKRRNKKPPLKIELPIFEFADKNCLFELGGFNKTNKGVSLMVFDEELNLYDGIKFFKGKNRKVNGKQAIVPVTIGSHVVFGSVFQRQSKLDICCNIWIYKICMFRNNSVEIEGKEIEYKSCICELVHMHFSSIFSMKDIEYDKFKDVIALSLKKTMIKECKKSFTNAWMTCQLNTNELALIEDLETIVKLVPKTFYQIINVKDMIEDYFIENDKSSIRSCLFVFRLDENKITIFFHIFEDLDIKRLKQEKKSVTPKIFKSFRSEIPIDYVFSLEIAKFFMCPERTASSLYEYIKDGERNSMNYLNGVEIPFAIRLFKG